MSRYQGGQGIDMTPFSAKQLRGELAIVNDRIKLRPAGCPRWGWFWTGVLVTLAIEGVIALVAFQ